MARAGATSSKARRRNEAAFGLLWHAAWILSIAATMAVLAFAGVPAVGPEMLALGAAAAAGLLGAVLSTQGRPGQMFAVLGWGLAGATACHLTGGVAGPLAAWCLAPAAAATAFRGRETLALGAAAAFAAAAVSTLDGLLLQLPHSSAVAAPWLGLVALVTVTLGFGAGLIGFQGDVGRDNRRKARADQVLEILDRQPLL
ncbi:MAG TPA: hypothetical protein VFH92_05115, partial [Phenylobacterium sp.]|nr:hypothetical protein [Phenylobacterium sp.]